MTPVTSAASIEGHRECLLLAVAVIAVIVLVVGGSGSTLHFLLWIGAVLLVLAIVVALVRFVTGRRVERDLPIGDPWKWLVAEVRIPGNAK